MSLAIEKKEFSIIDIDALQHLINEVYGFPFGYDGYSIMDVADIQHCDGGYYEFSSAPIDNLIPDDIQITLRSSVNEVITDLARKGHMPFGTFLIWIEY
jgi:hypothetical protein